jgi:putative spermidine/putrescine transport system ATP-binding protein
MDEPLSNLDARLRVEMRAEIRRIHRELGRTTIYVTHDQDEALSLADRIVVLRQGVVQQIGSPRQVYSQPCNVHVARFVGFRNLLEMEIVGGDGERVELAGSGLSLTGTLVQPVSGRRALAALRPEEISLGDAASPSTIPAQVRSVEYCGRESLVDVVCAKDVRLQVRTSAQVGLGDPVHLHVPPERVLVYPHEHAGGG